MQIENKKFFPIYNTPLSSFKNYSLTNSIDTVSFSGLKNNGNKALFVFDLDGTFAHGTNEDIQRVLELQKQTNATLAYATGRTIKEFYKLQAKKREKGISLPTPEHLVTNNGQFVYENIVGNLIEDLSWKAEIKEKTGFDRNTAYSTMKNIAHRPEYKHRQDELSLLQNLSDFETRAEEDYDFWDSKISYYEWNPSEFMTEFFVSSDVDINKLKETIQEELEKQGIKTKFILNKFPKEIMDACDDKLLRQSRPLRESQDGTMTALFLCPADKADGIEYLSKKLGISNSEIIMAGNESNDVSMADFTKKGAFFICLGNASKILKEYVEKVRTDFTNMFPNNIISTKNEGAAGITEGIREIIG